MFKTYFSDTVTPNHHPIRYSYFIIFTVGSAVVLSDPGSPGNETSYLGLATVAAVQKFQGAQGISPISGYVDHLTRTALTVFVH